MRVVFLGTPDFAVPTLRALINSKHEVLAVVTQPDKERDRRVVTPSPVKEEALKHNIKVLQYNKIRLEGVEDLKALNPDIMVTCAYGQIISQEILDIAKYGVINVHGSLLPKYRGSAPIQWSVINGETKTGITIMQTALGVDCGDMILQKEVEIGKYETAGELFDRLAIIAPDVLLEAMDLIENGKAVFVKQNEEEATHCPKLEKSNGLIDWNEDANTIFHKVYGMNPWPSAYCTLNGKMFKIHKVDIVDVHNNGFKPGDVIELSSKSYGVFCKDKVIKLLEVQLEGKKRMPIEEFILGYDLKGASLN